MSAQRTAEKARDDFDLGEFLDNGPAPESETITVYTDRDAGKKLGGAEEVEGRTVLGMPQREWRTWGIMGKVFNLKREKDGEDVHADEIARLMTEANVVSAKLEETAIDFTLKAVPPFVKKDAKRAAKKHLGINEKVTPNHPRVEEYDDEYAAQILHRVCDTMHLRSVDVTHAGISIENARKLKDRLDEWEWARLDEKIGELLWRRSIAEDAVSDADF